MIDCVAIVSGGMDSVTLLHYVVKEKGRTPAVLTFQYGQKHQKEVAFAQYHAQQLNCPDHQILDLTPFTALFAKSALVDEATAVPDILDVMGDPQPVTYVPNRNMIFLSLAAAYAETMGATAVYYGAQRHDIYGYWDTTPTFLASINELFALNRKTPLRVEAPFVKYSKADLLRIGLDLGIDYAQTWSCYKGADKACGNCPTCAERLQAFAEVGIPDPLLYMDA